MDTSGPLQNLRLQGVNKPLPANPFLIRHSVEAFLGGTIDGASKENRGASYVLKVRSKAQFDRLLQMSKLSDETPVSVIEHPHLNTVRCVVSCIDAIDLPDEYILRELQDQGVKEIHRIKRRNPEGKLENTPTIVLTITGTVIPQHVHFGWTRCPTRNYYPNPMRCYQCWDFGHTAKRCPSVEQICGNCSKHHPIDAAMATDDDARPNRPPCKEQQFCKFCKNSSHPTSSRKCPVYLKEVEVNRLKVDQGIPYPQARREIELRCASGQTGSFAKVTGPSTTSQSKDQEIADLRKMVKDLQAAKNNQTSAVGNRMEAIKQNGTIEDLIRKVSELTQTIGKLQANLDVKDKVIEKLRTMVQNSDGKDTRKTKQTSKTSSSKANATTTPNIYDIFSDSEEMEVAPTQTPKRDRVPRDSSESGNSSTRAPRTKRVTSRLAK
ncbi:uncharacterized protein LOC134221408 [Armigeres subalbatus]|uniref:uncharacterized protein LOC134221408 n=1 Tax=Armigeres subalbatus TaxID=124917 RepID=UPI002ED4FF58